MLTFQSDRPVMGSKIDRRAILGHLSGIEGTVTPLLHLRPTLHVDLAIGSATPWIARAMPLAWSNPRCGPSSVTGNRKLTHSSAR